MLRNVQLQAKRFHTGDRDELISIGYLEVAENIDKDHPNLPAYLQVKTRGAMLNYLKKTKPETAKPVKGERAQESNCYYCDLFDNLTDDECLVAQKLGEGYSLRQIEADTDLSIRQVRTIVKHLRAKLSSYRERV